MVAAVIADLGLRPKSGREPGPPAYLCKLRKGGPPASLWFPV